ncbi:hypothetical protein [Burkholderia orbicola]|uniref:hypothetical protein n=1 Tax=Burkholderia orbicola TaxID=2978683 RepID=UPI0026501C5F|nr:hypothetical protein [Burkholderia orbicola]MDN7558238.1 hypothetical protein [Burkholderia orbicola]
MGILAGLLDMALVGLIYAIGIIVVTTPLWGAVWYAIRYREQKREAVALQDLLSSDPQGVQDIAVKVRFGLAPLAAIDEKKWRHTVDAYRRFYPEEFFKYQQQGIL